jgi:hypothetical protein
MFPLAARWIGERGKSLGKTHQIRLRCRGDCAQGIQCARLSENGNTNAAPACPDFCPLSKPTCDGLPQPRAAKKKGRPRAAKSSAALQLIINHLLIR